MKRKLKWLAIVLAVSLLGFGTALLLWPRDRITAESYEEIRVGMTENDVEQLLTRVGMKEENAKDQIERLTKLGNAPFGFVGEIKQEPEGDFEPVLTRIWIGRRAILGIEYDRVPDGRVRRKLFLGIQATEPSFMDRLRAWLGW